MGIGGEFTPEEQALIYEQHGFADSFDDVNLILRLDYQAVAQALARRVVAGVFDSALSEQAKSYVLARTFVNGFANGKSYNRIRDQRMSFEEFHTVLKEYMAWEKETGIVETIREQIRNYVHPEDSDDRLYPQEPGRIERLDVSVGQTVKAGDVLFVIDAPQISEELKIAEVEIELARSRLARVAANADDLAQRSVIESELGSSLARKRGLEERRTALVVRAPFDGTITDVNPEILPGHWVGRAEQIAFLSSGQGSVARGYLVGNDIVRLTANASGWFVPDDVSQPKLPVTLAAIAEVGAGEIEIPQLSSQHHGAIAVHVASEGRSQRLVPVSAHYAVVATIDGGNFVPVRTVQGALLLDGEGISFAERIWRRVLMVLFREAGF